MEWKNYNYEFEGLAAHLERIDAKKRNLDVKRPIPSYIISRVKDALTVEWTYNSNSIEGNTLTLRETQMVIEEGLTIGGKSLREHFEAVNHHDAIALVESLVSDSYLMNTSDIMAIHTLVLQRIGKEFGGRYRTHGVRISGANFIPPNALKVSDLMDDLIQWVNHEATDLHLLVKAAIYHHRFVWIHPFFDGNGRTVRLSFNLLLLQAGFPPAIILTADRKKYYRALDQANKGDYSKLVLLILQAAERTLDIYLSHLDNTYEDYKPILDIVSEPDIPYSQEYVSLLARKGQIDAYKEGRDWVTSKAAVKEYILKRKRNRILT